MTTKRKSSPAANTGRPRYHRDKIDVVQDDVCDCEQALVARRGFPKWLLLGLAAIPIGLILIDDDDDTPTPTDADHHANRRTIQRPGGALCSWCQREYYQVQFIGERLGLTFQLNGRAGGA